MAAVAATTRIASDHTRDITAGWSVTHEWWMTGTSGLPHRSRQAATIMLIGFHSATYCIQVGIPCGGTKAFEMNARGNNQVSTACVAASGVATLMPMSAPTQLSA